MVIYSSIITPRLQYVIGFLSRYFGREIRVTSNREEFSEDPDDKINYSYTSISSNEIFIQPVALLFENTISQLPINCFQHPNGYKAFFATDGKTGFDLFAGLFYLLSRYEEYLPHQKDLYGRYAHQNSLAYKEGFLHQPLVNIWLEDFRELVKQHFPASNFELPTFSFIPTYDIDIAWSYRNKGFVRTTGGLAKSILKGQWRTVKERVGVLTKRKKDPFDSYNWMDEIHAQFNLHPLYFFHVGHQRNSFDKNISVTNSAFRHLIRRTAARYSVGLHPSWHSGDEPSSLLKEKKILESIVQKTIAGSRQHYIRLTLPNTYQQLIAVGITDDYSMGYGTVNGFRASAATPFYWYNLKTEETTNLLLHPFCYMDANSFFEQKFSSDQALQEILCYYQEVKKVHGTLITIWHNPFLGKDKLFEGWKEKYREFLQSISA